MCNYNAVSMRPVKVREGKLWDVDGDGDGDGDGAGVKLSGGYIKCAFWVFEMMWMD